MKLILQTVSVFNIAFAFHKIVIGVKMTVNYIDENVLVLAVCCAKNFSFLLGKLFISQFLVNITMQV